MDRTVIVLSPEEWEKRITLEESMEQAWQQLHYAITKEAGIGTIIWNIKNDIEKGGSTEGVWNELQDALRVAQEMTTCVRLAQSYIGNVQTMIKHYD